MNWVEEESDGGCMQGVGKLAGREAQLLVDGGSEANVISSEWVRENKMETEKAPLEIYC